MPPSGGGGGGGSLRDRLHIVTKCGVRLVSHARPSHKVKCYDLSAAHITASVDASLAALRCGHIDTFLLHRPDPLADPAEVAAALYGLVGAGKVRRVGVSNFSPAQCDALQAALTRHAAAAAGEAAAAASRETAVVGGAVDGPASPAAASPAASTATESLRLAVNQVQVSPLHLDALTDGTLDHAATHGMEVMAWSPLGGGSVLARAAEMAAREAPPAGGGEGASGDDGGEEARALRVARELLRVARELGVGGEGGEGGGAGGGWDVVAMAWVMRLPCKPTVITGTSSGKRVARAVQAAAVADRMSREQWYAILQASMGEEVA